MSDIIAKNRRNDRWFKYIGLAATLFGLLFLAVLLIDILWDGAGRLDWQFMTSFASRKAERAGILAPFVGSLWIMIITSIIACPVGIMAAIYLEEYAKKSRLTAFIEINIANLAGVPSVIYGLLGLGVFVRFLSLDRSILAGGATLALLAMPVIIVSTREALRAIPPSIREASLALGASRWQTISKQVLPSAMPGIFTGIILALSRAVGETAPLIVVGALAYIAFLPESPVVGEFPFINLEGGLFDPFSILPIQIFNWTSRPQHEFLVNAAAAIIVLLLITFAMNAVAIWLRHRFSKNIRW